LSLRVLFVLLKPLVELLAVVLVWLEL